MDCQPQNPKLSNNPDNFPQWNTLYINPSGPWICSLDHSTTIRHSPLHKAIKADLGVDLHKCMGPFVMLARIVLNNLNKSD